MRYNMEDAYGLKQLFENIFGRKAWFDLKHSSDLKTWKNYCVRLLSAIEVSAKATIQVVDSQWLEELTGEVEHGKKMLLLSDSFEQLFANLSASLGSISFLQLGMIPTRLSQNNITLRHASNWKLDSYRSVQSVQNKEQQKNLHNKSRREAEKKPQAYT